METPLALIIEDNSELADLFADAVRDAGFAVEVCYSGEVALEKLSTITPQITIVDLHLPHISGKTIIKTIRDNPNMENTRVIITSADARLAESLRDQVDLALLKPVNFSQLRDLATRLKSQIQ